MGPRVALRRLASHRRRHRKLPCAARAHHFNDVVDEVPVKVAVLGVLFGQAVRRQRDAHGIDAGIGDQLRPALRRLELRPHGDGVLGARESRTRILRLGAIADVDFHPREILGPVFADDGRPVQEDVAQDAFRRGRDLSHGTDVDRIQDARILRGMQAVGRFLGDPTAAAALALVAAHGAGRVLKRHVGCSHVRGVGLVSIH
ncbi:hypothetical protein D3C71_1431960 [compost metagenome]